MAARINKPKNYIFFDEEVAGGSRRVIDLDTGLAFQYGTPVGPPLPTPIPLLAGSATAGFVVGSMVQVALFDSNPPGDPAGALAALEQAIGRVDADELDAGTDNLTLVSLRRRVRANLSP